MGGLNRLCDGTVRMYAEINNGLYAALVAKTKINSTLIIIFINNKEHCED